jgi:hypothetical protein
VSIQLIALYMARNLEEAPDGPVHILFSLVKIAPFTTESNHLRTHRPYALEAIEMLAILGTEQGQLQLAV